MGRGVLLRNCLANLFGFIGVPLALEKSGHGRRLKSRLRVDSDLDTFRCIAFDGAEGSLCHVVCTHHLPRIAGRLGKGGLEFAVTDVRLGRVGLARPGELPP